MGTKQQRWAWGRGTNRSMWGGTGQSRHMEPCGARLALSQPALPHHHLLLAPATAQWEWGAPAQHSRACAVHKARTAPTLRSSSSASGCAPASRCTSSTCRAIILSRSALRSSCAAQHSRRSAQSGCGGLGAWRAAEARWEVGCWRTAALHSTNFPSCDLLSTICHLS